MLVLKQDLIMKKWVNKNNAEKFNLNNNNNKKYKVKTI